MDLLHFLILGLTTWRISSLLTSDSEEGPFGLLTIIRRYGLKLTGAFECVWCMSIWVGLIITMLYWIIPDYTTWICLPLALSGLAVMVDKNAG